DLRRDLRAWRPHSGRSVLEGRRQGADRWPGPRRCVGRLLRHGQGHRATADRLRLPLRLRDAPGDRRPAVLCAVGVHPMTGILSLTTYLPLGGVAAILLIRMFGNGGDVRAASAARWIALATTLATLALSVLLVAAFDRTSSAF